jgi:hypothetical protein
MEEITTSATASPPDAEPTALDEILFPSVPHREIAGFNSII